MTEESTSWLRENVAQIVTWVILAFTAVAALAYRDKDIEFIDERSRENREAIKGVTAEVRAVRESLIRIEVKLGTHPPPSQ
jgi:predicted negative regulator of RcsB-dependent stress response